MSHEIAQVKADQHLTSTAAKGHTVGLPELLGIVIARARMASPKLIAGVSGVAAAEAPERTLAAGRVLQSAFAGNFAEQLKSEWADFVEKGRIKPDYTQSTAHAENTAELLELLESGPADRHTFEFFRKLFMVASAEAVDSRESMLPREYLRIARTLSGGEIVLLVATNRSAAGGVRNQVISVRAWLDPMQKESGLVHEELIVQFERALILKGLLTKRRNADESAAVFGPHGRLTDLGAAMCKYFTTYDAVAMAPTSNG
jgi:hypothetical protein